MRLVEIIHGRVVFVKVLHFNIYVIEPLNGIIFGFLKRHRRDTRVWRVL